MLKELFEGIFNALKEEFRDFGRPVEEVAYLERQQETIQEAEEKEEERHEVEAPSGEEPTTQHHDRTQRITPKMARRHEIV